MKLRIDFRARRSTARMGGLLVAGALAAGLAAAPVGCAGGSDGTGSGGKGGSSSTGSGGSTGTGAGGSTGTGTGGTGTGGGTGGSTGTGGTAAGGSGAGGTTGTGGATGTGGTTGAGGSTGGAGGTGGTPSALRCPAGTFSPPTLTGLTPQKVAGVPPADTFGQGFSIIEGPVWIDGVLYLSQINATGRPPGSRLLKVVPGGATTIIAPDDGTNGLAVDANGDIIAAIHKDGSICRIRLSDPTNPQPIATAYMGNRFNSPNDLTLRSDGNIYFSDPDHQSPQPTPQSKQRLYRISPTGTVSVVDETLSQPNGVTLSVDEKTLYVSGGGGLYQYPLMADGTPGARAPVGNASMFSGSDGMAMDCAGDLYVVANRDVIMVNAAGSVLGRLTLPSEAQAATNVAFGGADRKTLYITSLGSTPGLYKVDLSVPGMPY